MSTWRRRVESYRISVFRSSTLATRRQILLRLDPAEGESVNEASITFEPSPPSGFLSFNSGLATIRLALSDYEDVCRLLRTEGPLYFTAYEAGDPPVRFAGLSTDPDGRGEGFDHPAGAPAARR